jgi:hypothetical protein
MVDPVVDRGCGDAVRRMADLQHYSFQSHISDDFTGCNPTKSLRNGIHITEGSGSTEIMRYPIKTVDMYTLVHRFTATSTQQCRFFVRLPGTRTICNE